MTATRPIPKRGRPLYATATTQILNLSNLLKGRRTLRRTTLLKKDNSAAINVYCPECPPGGTIGHPGGQQKKILPFGHGRDLAALNGTGLQNKSFQDRAKISKA